MREMKDSGIPWIGEIPKGWNICKVRKHYRFQTGFTPASENPDYYDDSGAEWVTISDLTGGRFIPSSTKKHISNLYLNEFKPAICPKGSLLYSFKLSVGQTAFVTRDIYSNEAIACFYPDESLRFLYYSSVLIEQNAQINIYGARLLNQKRIYNAIIVYPPIDEQLRIADFLDAKCDEIDSILEKTRTSIEEYKKLKQSVITEAVTKGIRGERPMKDSGVEWIGEIPKVWSCKKIKHCFSLRDERNYLPMDNVVLLSLYTDIGVFPHGEHEERGNKAVTVEGYKIVHKNDIVVNIILAWMGAIGITDYDGVTSPAYDVWMPRASIAPRYFHYLFRTPGIAAECYKYGRGIMLMRWRTYSDEFKQISIPNPPIEEQQEIAAYLDEKCAAIDSLITSKEALIIELESYKKSLIYEYVTGKKEVPES